MVHSFDVGRFPAGSTPDVTGRVYAAAQTFTSGALLVLDGNGELVECANHPTTVTCVASQGADTGYGYQAANNPNPKTWQNRRISTYDIASKTTQFKGRMVGAADAHVTPTQAMVGDEYGAKKLTNGDWVIDTTETTDKCLVIVNIDRDGEFALFTFIDAAIGL